VTFSSLLFPSSKRHAEFIKALCSGDGDGGAVELRIAVLKRSPNEFTVRLASECDAREARRKIGSCAASECQDDYGPQGLGVSELDRQSIFRVNVAARVLRERSVGAMRYRRMASSDELTE
jgi:hypothetical protein